LAFVMEKLGYDLYWHLAPIFDEDNLFGNPVNHWGSQGYCIVNGPGHTLGARLTNPEPPANCRQERLVAMNAMLSP
jgi:hypothetical protein